MMRKMSLVFRKKCSCLAQSYVVRLDIEHHKPLRSLKFMCIVFLPFVRENFSNRQLVGKNLRVHLNHELLYRLDLHDLNI